MERVDKPNIFLKKIFEMPYYNVASKVVVEALRLGIFEELKETMKSSELAKKKGWHIGNTEIFLQSLFSLNYVDKKGELYKNTEDTNRYLVKNSKDYVGGVLEVFGTDLGGAFPASLIELLTVGGQENNTVSKDRRLHLIGGQ